MDNPQSDHPQWDTMWVAVRADTGRFAQDIATMRAQLDGPFSAGAQRAGQVLETSLSRALRTGKFGFDDLRKVALAALADIAQAAIKAGMAQAGIAGGIGGAIGGAIGGGGGQGLLGQLLRLGLGALGLPGRATGGLVAPDRPYRVGERGPELFVPNSAGTILPVAAPDARAINITVNLHGAAPSDPLAMQQSGRQVARAVRAAMMSAAR